MLGRAEKKSQNIERLNWSNLSNNNIKKKGRKICEGIKGKLGKKRDRTRGTTAYTEKENCR